MTEISSEPVVEYCGEHVTVTARRFDVGRQGDLVVDADNRFLHRRFLAIVADPPGWALRNVGTRLTASVTTADGIVDSLIGPGGMLPLLGGDSIVRFRAGPTNYELTVTLPPAYRRDDEEALHVTGDATTGHRPMSPDQLRLVIALAEPALADGRRGTGVPSSAAAALRLGWTVTKFNRKLDSVCRLLESDGVRGLHGAPGRLTSDRRSRLVQHAIESRLVTRDDLVLLDVASEQAEESCKSA